MNAEPIPFPTPAAPAAGARDAADTLSPELLARAASIDAERALDAANVPGADPGADPGAQDPGALPTVSVEQLAGNITAFLQLAVAAFAPAFPQLPAVWPADVCAAVGKAAAPVALKRGWLFQFTAYQDEIALAIVVVPLLSPTAAAIKQGRRPPAAGTGTVTVTDTVGAKPIEKSSQGAGVTFLRPSSTQAAT